VRYWSKIAAFNLRHLYLVHRSEMMPLKFRRARWRQKNPRVIDWRCLHDPRFSRSGAISACDRRTDRQTDRQRLADTRRQHYIALAYSVALQRIPTRDCRRRG